MSSLVNASCEPRRARPSFPFSRSHDTWAGGGDTTVAALRLTSASVIDTTYDSWLRAIDERGLGADAGGTYIAMPVHTQEQ